VENLLQYKTHFKYHKVSSVTSDNIAIYKPNHIWQELQNYLSLCLAMHHRELHRKKNSEDLHKDGLAILHASWENRVCGWRMGSTNLWQGTMAGFSEHSNKFVGSANAGHMSKYQYSKVALVPTYINPKHATALPYTRRLQTTHLCVLRLRKNPSSLRACSLISWLSAASNLKIVRTPCLMSKAGTIEAGCSDMRDISICSTSWRFSSCNKTQYHY